MTRTWRISFAENAAKANGCGGLAVAGGLARAARHRHDGAPPNDGVLGTEGGGTLAQRQQPQHRGVIAA